MLSYIYICIMQLCNSFLCMLSLVHDCLLAKCENFDLVILRTHLYSIGVTKTWEIQRLRVNHNLTDFGWG